MRLNEPVTQREFPFPSGSTLVSVTDTDSRIRYCNAAFVEVSGFTEQELLGQPHNIVRHPDMPTEAFRDLWETVRAGEPWRGLVKNRRRDGDHYWVVANVTPIVEGGRVTGYMSVRTEPTREQVRQAEALYARLRAQAAGGTRGPVLRLRRGHVSSTGVGARLMAALRPGLTTQATLFPLAIGGAMLGVEAIPDLSSGWVLGLRAAALAVGIGAFAAWFDQSVRRPLSEVADFARGMAACDLTQVPRERGRGEIRRLWTMLAQVSVNLRGVVSDVRGAVIRVEQSASELAGASQGLGSRTEAQASALEESAAALDQMSSAVATNSDAAQQADALANQADTVARRGRDTVGEVVATMGAISEASRRIADITQLIDSIAFQTNILALNAAVEAARAGEQGRGFTVVAAEVRELAQRSSRAARDIKTLIGDSLAKVDHGAQGVDEASGRIGDIVQAVDRVAELIRQIAQASSEQSGGVRQISEAVAQLERTTQENSALVEESSAAAQILSVQATRLRGAVQIFRTTA